MVRKSISVIVACLITLLTNAQSQDVTISENKTKLCYEIRNGLLGVVVPMQSSYHSDKPLQTLAPIQSVIYRNGIWSDTTPNYLIAPTPVVGLMVSIVTNTRDQCTVILKYAFNKPTFNEDQKKYFNSKAGKGYYQSMITVTKGSRSIVLNEDADFEISYEFNVNNGLNADKARYRGTSATDQQSGYEPAGITYRPDNQREAMDATVDISYTKEREFPLLSLWDPGGGEVNTGRYWQLFNSNDNDNSNLFGMFQGRPSKMYYAHIVGPQLILKPGSEREKNIAAIRLMIERRTADDRWSPRKKFEWMLFISTKKDLRPPVEMQPIGIEMNRLSHLAQRIDGYASKPIAPIKAFFDCALYMPAADIQQLILKVKNDDKFRGMLNNLDPYFREITNMWRYPDSALHVIKNYIELGQTLRNMYKNGDGIYTFRYRYWLGSLNFKGAAFTISCLFADKHIPITPQQKNDLLSLIGLMARVEWDNDNVPMYDSSGVNLGPTNMRYQYNNNGRNFFALILANDPEFKERAMKVADETRNDIRDVISKDGISFGTPHYSQASINPVLFNMLLLKQVNIVDLFKEQKPRLDRFIDFYTNLLTPLSPRFNNNRKLISLGDGSEESAVTFALLGTGIKNIDPVRSAELLGNFFKGPARLDIFGSIALAVDLTKEIPPNFQGGTANYPGYMSHFRSAVNSNKETALWVLNGEIYNDHRNDDRGEVSLYALNAPLSISRSSFYYPRADDARIRSVVVPFGEFPEWNGPNQPISMNQSKGNPWINSEQLEFAKLGRSFISRSLMTGRNEKWFRNAYMITLDDDMPIIGFYDSLSGNLPAIWSMMFMSQGTVNSTVGAIQPVDKFWDGLFNKSHDLPEATPEKELTKGMNIFIFNGQDWVTRLHPSGGINWYLYSFSAERESLTMSQWTNNWQNAVEVEEFRSVYNRQYTETQQILRLKSNGPFFIVILPFFKGADIYKDKVKQVGLNTIQLKTNKSELELNPNGYSYNSASGQWLASFSPATISYNGISISGGATEVSIEKNDIKIRIHGNAGRRELSFPFKVVPLLPDNNIQKVENNNTVKFLINYTGSNSSLLSTEKGYSEYVFKKL